MKKIIIIFFLLLSKFTLVAQVTKPIGINLSPITYYSREIVFTDVFRQSKEWFTINADGSGPFSTELPVSLGANGYPLKVPIVDGVNPPQGLRTLVLYNNNSPQGKYRLIVKGKGKVKVGLSANATFDCPVDTYVNVTNKYGVTIDILESKAEDPISDIKFILPKYTEKYISQKYTDEFLDFIKDFQTIRFMDWLRTNNSKVVKWEDRGKYNYNTQTSDNGASWEEIAELCNTSKKDMWICIPHKADDNYIRELAKLLKNKVSRDRKIYIEYSNEVWNGSFKQHSEAAALASNLGYTGQEWERAWKYTMKRSADLFYIFNEEFADRKGSLVRVIPSQAANTWLSGKLLSFFNDPLYNPHQVKGDVLAIAPYFGHAIASEISAEGLIDTITIEEIMNRARNSLATSFKWMDDSKKVADQNNLKLVAYEGGQHMVAVKVEDVENVTLTNKLNAANRHKDMQEITCKYLNYWYQNVGEPFMYFSSIGGYSKHGSWGLKEYMEEMDTPKYLALKNCIFPNNKVVFAEEGKVLIYPNPSENGGVFHIISPSEISDNNIKVYDYSGRLIDYSLSTVEKNHYLLQIKSKGQYVVTLLNDGKSQTFKVISQ